MTWIVLLLAGLFEVVWALGLKHTHGFTRFWPSVITVSALIISIGLLGWAMRTLPVGTAYAIWVGVGVLGTALVGMLALNEPVSVARLLSLGLVLAGVLGLKLTSGAG